MTDYKVTVPLVQVATTAGGAGVQVAQGGVLPANITKAALKNLIELDYVEKVEEVKEDEGPKPGTADFIVNEVGDDVEKAKAALAAETGEGGQNRSGLVKKLEAIIAKSAS